jgi:acyl-CoA-binding protein
MSDLATRFAQAQEDVKQLPERPGNMVLLRLYALFKQATEGDAGDNRPGMADMVARYKFDAWAALKGVSTDDAQTKYIELVEELKTGA